MLLISKLNRRLVLVLIVSLLASAKDISKQVIYPEKEWVRILPEQAGFDVRKLNEVLAGSNICGPFCVNIKDFKT